MDKKHLLRQLPKMDVLLGSAALATKCDKFSHAEVRDAVRRNLASLRQNILSGAVTEVPPLDTIERDIVSMLEHGGFYHLRRVVNATGVVLHTNLGRAPLGRKTAEHVAEIAAGYSNLEYDLALGGRGSRYDHVERLACDLTGAEAALVVNNNAAAVFLMLNTLCAGERVTISRGELVEIGGSFRIPQIMELSGAELLEVGTTNKTHAADYEEAMRAGRVGALLKVHRSNFTMTGFTESVTVRELAQVASACGCGSSEGMPLVLYDMGAALMFPNEILGIPGGETIRGAISDGADVVCFSGDKLFGAAQAGIIVGRRDLIGSMRRNNMTRVLRVDKMTLAATEAVLMACCDPGGAISEVPTLRMLAMSRDECRARACKLAGSISSACQDATCRVVDTQDEVGGGSLPGVLLDGAAVAVTVRGHAALRLEEVLRRASTPVITRIVHDEVLVSPRTLLQGDAEDVVRGFEEAIGFLKVVASS